MSQVTTHVLDISRGRPAAGIAVRLEDDSGRRLGEGTTDDDGRCSDLGPEKLDAGVYRLRFATGPYLDRAERGGFYPEVTIAFEVAASGEHYHVPLLLSPFGYSTYRGS